MIDIGSKIMAKRFSKDISLEDVSLMSGISVANLRKMEYGEKRIDICSLIRIARAIDEPYDEILSRVSEDGCVTFRDSGAYQGVYDVYNVIPCLDNLCDMDECELDYVARPQNCKPDVIYFGWKFPKSDIYRDGYAVASEKDILLENDTVLFSLNRKTHMGLYKNDDTHPYIIPSNDSKKHYNALARGIKILGVVNYVSIDLS